MYIFLDIDGVLNMQADWARNGSLNQKNIEAFARFANQVPGSRIILTSSWRKGFVSRNNKANSPQIQALEKALSKYGLSVLGKTDDKEPNRLEAIEQFLAAHPGEYIILDDDISEYGKPVKNLFLIDCKRGFTEADSKKCLKLVKTIH